MNKFVCILLILLAILVGVESRRLKKNKVPKNEEGNNDCNRWVYGECVPKNSTLGCGKGTRVATRNGTDCKSTKKTVNCTLRCNGHNKCTYGKLTFSECDPSTQTVVGTKSLIKGDAACKQTITVIKKCKKNKKNEKKQRKGKQHLNAKNDKHSKKSRGKNLMKED